MKLLVLAAGYATRLYPLTLTQPKPLLPVGGKPMIDYTLQAFGAMEGITEIIVISNAKFFSQFSAWARMHEGGSFPPITVLDDGSTEDANKKGAIGDIVFALESRHLDEDLVVVAGDNLFTESVQAFPHFGISRQAPALGIYDVKTLEAAKKFGVVSVDAQGVLTRFEEKPQQPSTTLIGIALYFYPRAVLPLLREYVASGGNPDQPGRFVQWLYTRMPVYTWQVPGDWYDIGSKETLEAAQGIFPETSRLEVSVQK